MQKEEPEYFITRWRNGFRISKFEFTNEPTAVYFQNEYLTSCSCPAGRFGKCKHIQMVKDWITDGEPPVFDMSPLERLLERFEVKAFMERGIRCEQLV